MVRVEGDYSETDTGLVGKVMETFNEDNVRNIEWSTNKKVLVKLKMFNLGRPGVGQKVEFLVYSGVNKFLAKMSNFGGAMSLVVRPECLL